MSEAKKQAYTPFAPCINNTVTQDKATGAANQITAPKLLDNVGIWVSALRTNKSNCKIWRKRRRLDDFGCCERERLRISHGWSREGVKGQVDD